MRNIVLETTRNLGAFALLIPPGFSHVFFAGFLSGYVRYETIHFATRHASMKGKLCLWLKRAITCGTITSIMIAALA